MSEEDTTDSSEASQESLAKEEDSTEPPERSQESLVEEEDSTEPPERSQESLVKEEDSTEPPEEPQECPVKQEDTTEPRRVQQESLVKILRRRSTRIRWKKEDSSTGSSDSDESEMVYLRGSPHSLTSGMSLTLAESTVKSMIALPDEKIDMITATSFLQQKAAEIRKERVNWHSYMESQMISEEDYNFIAEFDGVGCADDDDDGSNARMNLLIENRRQAAQTFLNLLEKISRDLTIQYILTMIDDMLQEDRKRVEIFHEYCDEKGESVWRPFMNLLNRSDGFIVHMSSRIITKIACWSQELMNKSDLNFYLAWLKDQLRNTGNEYMESIGRSLQIMLRIDEYRFPFVSMDGIHVIMDMLQRRINYQIQYQLIFCLWVLTFNPLLVEKVHKFNVIPILTYVLSNSVKDKVTRIILSLFRNLIETPEDIELAKEHSVAMVQCKVLKQLSILSHWKFDDEDIISDIAYLNEKLQASLQELSSFDTYSNQVKSGHLDWSPVHKSKKFWRDNAVRLNEGDYELLRRLIHLLETSKDPLILSVATFDIGEYVRSYPKGKHVIDDLGGKQLVMQLLGHEDPNVRYEALLAIQKLMVHSWEYQAKHLDEQQDLGAQSALSTSSMSMK